jgi:uncharacterized protein
MGNLWFYILVVMLPSIAITGWAALRVRSTYAKWSKVDSGIAMSAHDFARRLLDTRGLSNVRVEPVPGQLTDHYDPRGKVVRLSEGNFAKSSLAAVSVAAHECGHAIQDSVGYTPMKLRSGLFPVVNFANQLWFPLFFVGILGLGQIWIQLAVILFAAVLAFHVVTLPVEINASTRAYGLLTRYGILSRDEASGTRRVLTAAAFTYIAAALTALLTLLYLILVSRQ